MTESAVPTYVPTDPYARTFFPDDQDRRRSDDGVIRSHEDVRQSGVADLSVVEVAAMFAVASSTIEKAAEQGLLPSATLGIEVVIPRAEFLALWDTTAKHNRRRIASIQQLDYARRVAADLEA